jgi:hypothetical protein
MRAPTRLAAAGLAVALLIPLAACGDDESADEVTETTEAADDTTTTEGSEPTDDGGAAADEVAITGVDHAFEGVPDSIAAGTRLTFFNDSDVEIHELVVVRIDDGEQRPVAEIVADPAGIGTLLGGGPPAAVIVAAPGTSEPGAVLGDGTLAEPGRYALLCSIPTGVDPQEYLDAAAAAQGGPPDVEGGPPHFVQGMVAELEVTG